MRGPATPKQKRAVGIVQALFGVVLISPVLFLAAAFGTKFGIWGWRFGYLMTIEAAWWAALVGVVAALAAVAAAFIDVRRAGPFALAAVVVSAVTIALFIRHFGLMRAVAPDPDATTNLADPPGFSSRILARREGDGAVAVNRWAGGRDGCQTEGSIPMQIAPGSAIWALEQAGFDVVGAGVGSADGTREGFWFGFTHDATIRIRPGQTDVRVVAREDRPDGGEACRLTRRIAEAVQTGR